MAYCGYGEVNWCEALGTVLANDEVINGVSERGGYPVVKKKLRQWYLRITEYADRLLEGLETVDFSDAMKEMQTQLDWEDRKERRLILRYRVQPHPNPLRPERENIKTPPKKNSLRLLIQASGITLKEYGRGKQKKPDTGRRYFVAAACVIINWIS